MRSLIALNTIYSVVLINHSVRTQFAFPEEEVDYCRTPTGKTGICEPLVRCDDLLNARNLKLLRQSTCGFEGDIPKVCCPIGRQPDESTTRASTVRTRPATRPTIRLTTPLPIIDRPNDPSNGRTITETSEKLPQICGNRSRTIHDTRIVGGKPSKPGSWPWMAAVLIEDGGAFSPQCGGALISDEHIITASHCVVENGQTLAANRFKVRLGEHNIVEQAKEDAEVDYNVRSVRAHPKFEPRTYKNDIAILRLSRKVHFNPRISPICLPFDTKVLTSEENIGRSGHITGWGRLAFNGGSSDVLREADVEIVSNEECNKAFEKVVKITEQYLCAGSLGSKKDSCQGDSGGPLIQVDPHNHRYYLTGVVSFGRRCATPGFPGVYARVYYYLKWITDNL